MIKYPEYADELINLMTIDQAKWKKFWSNFYDKKASPSFTVELQKVREEQRRHSKRMLEILQAIELPSLSNIGQEAAQAISVIALHDSLPILRSVLEAFLNCYGQNKNNTYFQAIPSMTDRLRILERKPQRFGTQWELDENGYPFLPTMEDRDNVDNRRSEYGIEPLRWPKSLAIPEDKQPWLDEPLSKVVMRDITDDEFALNYQDYLE